MRRILDNSNFFSPTTDSSFQGSTVFMNEMFLVKIKHRLAVVVKIVKRLILISILKKKKNKFVI